MPAVTATIQPRQRVRITQQILQGAGTWTTTIEGEVVSLLQAKTGSWFAHSRDDRLWLDRLEVRLDDGEVVVCNLDRFSRVEIVGGAPVDAAATPQSGEEPIEA